MHVEGFPHHLTSNGIPVQSLAVPALFFWPRKTILSSTHPCFSFADAISGTQSLQWVGGHEQSRDDFMRHFPASPNKPRLSRSKHRPYQAPEPFPSAFSDPITGLKDHVIFTESPAVPGVPVVFRSTEERAVNPERLNLDRRQLLMCPILEGEERLRLLNLQHNSIGRLQHLNNLRRLVFLDLYDNLVHEITGLEGLVSLRVLMLGRNR